MAGRRLARAEPARLYGLAMLELPGATRGFSSAG